MVGGFPGCSVCAATGDTTAPGAEIEDFNFLRLQPGRQQRCGPAFWNCVQDIVDCILSTARSHPKLMLSIVGRHPDQMNVCFGHMASP
jgi:hypothetical protein